MWSARKIAIVTRTIAKHAYPTNVNPNAKPDKPAMGKVRVLVLAQKVKSVADPVRRLGAVMKQTLAVQLKVNAVWENIAVNMAPGL